MAFPCWTRKSTGQNCGASNFSPKMRRGCCIICSERNNTFFRRIYTGSWTHSTGQTTCNALQSAPRVMCHVSLQPYFHCMTDMNQPCRKRKLKKKSDNIIDEKISPLLWKTKNWYRSCTSGNLLPWVLWTKWASNAQCVLLCFVTWENMQHDFGRHWREYSWEHQKRKYECIEMLIGFIKTEKLKDLLFYHLLRYTFGQAIPEDVIFNHFKTTSSANAHIGK